MAARYVTASTKQTSPRGDSVYTRPMRDPDIREALVKHIARGHTNYDTLIRHEMGILQGQNRVDLVRVNGSLDGWEIKSDVDSLRRLDRQVEAFSQVLDRGTVVTTQKHLRPVLEALPEWWGVSEASRTRTGTIRIDSVRRPRKSPVLDAMATAQLLWREEALEALRARGLALGLSKVARWTLWDTLARELTSRELRQVVRDALRARQEWPAG